MLVERSAKRAMWTDTKDCQRTSIGSRIAMIASMRMLASLGAIHSVQTVSLPPARRVYKQARSQDRWLREIGCRLLLRGAIEYSDGKVTPPNLRSGKSATIVV